jgi:hypothetical protein
MGDLPGNKIFKAPSSHCARSSTSWVTNVNLVNLANPLL